MQEFFLDPSWATGYTRCNVITVAHRILSKFPILTTNWTSILGSGRSQPFRNTLKMKSMPALSPDNGTILSRILDTGTHTLKSGLTNAANVVVGVPTPSRNGVKALEANFDGHWRWLVSVHVVSSAATFA